MKYPLNNLDDSNYWHYVLQLSTYAWMLQKINPNFVIKDLILNHYDHEGKNTLYHCPYLKDECNVCFIFIRNKLYYKEVKIKEKEQNINNILLT